MASSGGMAGGLGGDRGSENFQPMWSRPEQGSAGKEHQQQATGREPKINLTKEEMDVLQQCSRESFYYRCVPLGLLFIGSTHILVKKQFISGHPRLGSIPKNMFAGLVAYIVGKLSYQGECRRQLMALPNSPIGEAMRQGKRGRDLVGDLSLGSISGGYAAHDQESTEEEPMSLGLKDNYLESGTQGAGLDDNERPTVDNVTTLAPEESAQSYVTYDELRKRNRTEHESKTSPSKPVSSYPKLPAQSQYSAERSSSRPKTNKYGDILEE